MTPSSTRRVVPPGYVVCELELVGQSPLLMSSGEADRESETFLAFRSLSKQRGKTLEQEQRLRELEWYTRLYYDEKIGVYIPGKNIKELLRSAATKWKDGENVKRSLVIPSYRIPLLYEGPRQPAKLWEAGFKYTTMCANSGAGAGRVERCRPCFDEWKLVCELAFDPDDLDYDRVCEIVERSEKYGLGDYRPEFGAFVARLHRKEVRRGKGNAKGSKPRDQQATRALKAHENRVKSIV